MKNIFLLPVFLLVSVTALAQTPVTTKAEILQVKVESLSDEQVRQLVEEMKQNGITFNQIDTYARQKGFPAPEVAKLKDRIKSLNLDKELMPGPQAAQAEELSDRELDDPSTVSIRDTAPMDEAEQKKSKIFGASLFNNSNLTFEPNLRIPTPKNYRLAAGDELVIDVYGYSEVRHALKVTPEGYVRIPNLGPVYVSGLTIDEAQVRITKQLATIYGGISSGNTSVQISLGSIRSIKVLLIGEITRPGSYTISSLSTIANALYVSGGPGENGSFRDIQVIRNGQPTVTFDLYDFLHNGDLTNNIILQDQDIIKVNPYKTRVELTGEVKRPSIFEVKDGETLQDVIDFAGGYTDISFRDVIRAYRINNKEREVISISSSEVASFRPRSGDKYFIDAILNRFRNRVMIFGSVFRPGEYALEEKMTVADLIRKADGVREGSIESRAIIFRLNSDFTPSALHFSLSDVLGGGRNILLQREDSVVIYSKLNQFSDYTIKIAGEVKNPGYFKYADSLHIEDLILMAGGLKDAASLKRIEISRRIRDKSDDSMTEKTAVVSRFDITADLSSTAGFALQPFDEITVRRSPNYSEQINVHVDGEVVYPGAYTILSKKEKISDLMARAGGLRPEAYAEGAVLIRKMYVNESDSALLGNKLMVFYDKLEDSTSMRKVQNSIEQKEQLLDINLVKILEKPGSKYDLYLEEGDMIKIPKKLQTVQLLGEIYFPKKVRFDKSITFRDYVRGAGGFTNNALKRRSYVIYSNGEVRSTRKVLFFNSYPKVKPGSEIYVPSKKQERGIKTPEVIGITTGIASLALIIVTVLDRIR